MDVGTTEKDRFEKCSKDPTVITGDLVRRAIALQRNNDEEIDAVLKHQPLPLDCVQRLDLSFHNILRIENLWELTNIRCLVLSNNSVETIDNLGHLVHLRRLDLSFNRISVIQNLDTLTQLENLVLFRNRISLIEGLDSLQRLELLSIGDNRISSLNNILVLRRLPQLMSVNLSGNPVCTEAGYREFVSAILPIEYLDYQLISEAVRSQGRQMFADEITRVELLELGSRPEVEDDV